MIDLYSWATPNGHKVHIMLRECGLEHRLLAVDIGRGDQFQPPFSTLGPNRKIPLLVDHDGPGGQALTLSESGAILIYLAEKTGKFLPAQGAARHRTLQWLMFQMSAVGPMMGQSNHFRHGSPQVLPYAIERFGNEVKRLHGVMEQHLASHAYFGGEDYSIADMAIFPWLRASEKHGILWPEHPRLRAWFETVQSRPAVRQALTAFA